MAAGYGPRVNLDPETCYEAVRSRDRRFEGRFVLGVTTTGVYCRPGCPARLPRRENVRFYASGAAAEHAGFRACLRCRPDRGVDASAWGRKSATVAHALRLIDAAPEPLSSDDLALRTGVTARQLRRLFDSELGASPAAIVRGRRLRFARLLLEQTVLPVTTVAHQAGFASVRRFHAAIRAAYATTPRALREKGMPDEPGVVLHLSYREPFAWDVLVRFLGPRALPGVETVGADRWCRKLVDGELEVTHAPERAALRLRVDGRGGVALLPLVTKVRSLFDLDADPLAIDAVLARDPTLRANVRARPGVRVPGAFERFELLVRTVLGQQISVAAATTHAGRFAARGLFEAKALAAADPASLGLPLRRARSLRDLAELVANGSLDLARELPDLPGIGPWTRAYYGMRALGDCDAFPAGDLVLKQHAVHSERWRPWRAYAAMRLWTKEHPDAG